MWAAIAQLWISVSLLLDTVNKVTGTVNKLASVAEEHANNFHEVSMIELASKKTKAQRSAVAELAATE